MSFCFWCHGILDKMSFYRWARKPLLRGGGGCLPSLRLRARAEEGSLPQKGIFGLRHRKLILTHLQRWDVLPFVPFSTSPWSRVSWNRGVRKGGIPHEGEKYDVCARGAERHRTVTQVRLSPSCSWSVKRRLARNICVTVRCRCAGGRVPSYRHPQRHVIVVPPG